MTNKMNNRQVLDRLVDLHNMCQDVSIDISLSEVPDNPFLARSLASLVSHITALAGRIDSSVSALSKEITDNGE